MEETTQGLLRPVSIVTSLYAPELLETENIPNLSSIILA